MGVCSGVRALIHVDIGNKLVDLTDFISPELTVIDATRVLTKHGPSGGDLEDVITLNKVFASTDPTLADSFACRLRGIDPMKITSLRAARARGFGNSDVSGARILEVKI
jgi:uncharacterized protein (DUF362 family)